jgi:hypothetical protein
VLKINKRVTIFWLRQGFNWLTLKLLIILFFLKYQEVTSLSTLFKTMVFFDDIFIAFGKNIITIE